MQTDSEYQETILASGQSRKIEAMAYWSGQTVQELINDARLREVSAELLVYTAQTFFSPTLH